MIVVGYLYNKNGMATWCVEAALALHLHGADVVLVKSKNITLPENYPVKVIDFDARGQDYRSFSTVKKISNKVKKYINILPFVKIEDGFLPALHQHLEGNGIKPECYLFNQSSYVNKKVQVSQYVVAWAYKPFLKDYLRKAYLLAKGFSSLHNNLYDAIFWNKIDWQSFKDATGVMSVSQKLTALIATKGVNVSTIYPGTNGGNSTEAQPAGIAEKHTVRLAMMAIDLDDPRKGLRKIITKLKGLRSGSFQLVLIGGCKDDFKQWVLADGFNATFTGLLSRDKAIDVLNTCDVLLFGSLVDDWGFVQVEAMSRGMAVLSPNASPFDEIIGRDDYLYDAQNDADLEVKLLKIVSADWDTINIDKAWFKTRYESHFSLNAFARQLLQTIKHN